MIGYIDGRAPDSVLVGYIYILLGYKEGKHINLGLCLHGLSAPVSTYGSDFWIYAWEESLQDQIASGSVL